jgi:hypothetical protein
MPNDGHPEQKHAFARTQPRHARAGLKHSAYPCPLSIGVDSAVLRFGVASNRQGNPMSLAVLRSRALAGMEAPAVSVEVHLANGLPGLTTVGLKTPIAKFLGNGHEYGLPRA